ncbi:MAG: hypothetical protein AAB383_05615 [Patescibacteria group bacterium]
MSATPSKNSIDFKDPFVIWGGLLIGLGIGFGGVLGGAIGGGAGLYIIQLGKKVEYSKSKKISIAAGVTVVAIVLYILVLGLILSAL